MSPWEFRIGQLVGYKPRGVHWRAKVTAVERDGKPFLAEIPVVDEEGKPIEYKEPPKVINLIADFGNYYLVEQAKGGIDPWLAARLDHDDDGGMGRKKLAERLGLKEPYHEALATVIGKWGKDHPRELLDDLLVFVHASWNAGRIHENGECAKLMIDRCAERGVACCANCTHYEDAAAIRGRMKA